MGERLKILLNGVRDKNIVNSDNFLDIDINSSNRPIPLNDISHIVDSSVQFNLERQNSDIYRVSGNINPYISNSLYIIPFSGGSTTPYIDPLEVENLNGFFGYTNYSPTNICGYTELPPTSNDIGFFDENGVSNYRFLLTYPKVIDDTFVLMKMGKPISDGIPIIEILPIEMSGKKISLFRTAINHGLVVGDEINLKNIKLKNSTQKFSQPVVKLGGRPTYEQSNERYFVLDILFDQIDLLYTPTSSFISFKKVIDGVESKYYMRKFTGITTGDLSEYDLTTTSFAKTINSQREVNFSFKSDIDVSTLRDNLGRPLTELYVTVIKENKSVYKENSDFNFNWTNISGGFLTENNRNINYNIRAYGDNQYPQVYINNINYDDTLFEGDIVEYNQKSLLETKLEDVYHRINLKEREDDGKLEGYFYKTHYLYKIRDFSTYISEGTTATTYNIPYYAIEEIRVDSSGNTNTTGSLIWRDLLDKGYIDGGDAGVDLPFVNGRHYIFNNIRYYLRRQDPPCNITEGIFNNNTQTTWINDGGIVISVNGDNFTGIKYKGEYNLGTRLTSGNCKDINLIVINDIDQKC
jgi:hypothetical protein